MKQPKVRYFAILVMALAYCGRDGVRGQDHVAISDAQRAKYWRAVLDMERARASLDRIVAELRVVCGSSTLATDEKGEPVCIQPKEEK